MCATVSVRRTAGPRIVAVMLASVGVGVLGACTDPETMFVAEPTTTESTASSTSSTVARIASGIEPGPSATTTSTTAGTTSTGSASTCVRLESFTNAEGWRIVNDGVMGGRSVGTGAIDNGVLVFSGNIETEGGGFSSVRGPVTVTVPADANEFRVRVRTDGRAYELQVDDAAQGRDPRITHYIPLPPIERGQWNDLSLFVDDAEARTFGVPRDASAIEMASLTSLGIILADGVDGPFEFEIDYIDACL